jgi:hypothetical protein
VGSGQAAARKEAVRCARVCAQGCVEGEGCCREPPTTTASVCLASVVPAHNVLPPPVAPCRVESELLASRTREGELNKEVAELRASLYVAEKAVARQRTRLELSGLGVLSGEFMFFKLPVKLFVLLTGYLEVAAQLCCFGGNACV